MRITLDTIESYLDFSSIQLQGSGNWVEPVFVSAFVAHCKDLKLRSCHTGNEYIDAMLSCNYNGDKTYSPIEHIDEGMQSVNKIAEQLSSVMLKNFFNLNERDQKDLKKHLSYLFSELMNNVLDHSGSPVGGYAMAQYYPSKHRIQFAIADRGVGFLKNIKLKALKIENEADAIEKALEVGFTASKRRLYGKERNAGFGLSAMKEILDRTSGVFIVISNDMMVRYKKKKLEKISLDTPYSGVVVAFDFYESEINLELSQILGGLREELQSPDDLF